KEFFHTCLGLEIATGCSCEDQGCVCVPARKGGCGSTRCPLHAGVLANAWSWFWTRSRRRGADVRRISSRSEGQGRRAADGSRTGAPVVGRAGGDSLMVGLLAERGICRVHGGRIHRKTPGPGGLREANRGIEGAHGEAARRRQRPAFALGRMERRERSIGRDSLRQRGIVSGSAENRIGRGKIVEGTWALHIEERAEACRFRRFS